MRDLIEEVLASMRSNRQRIALTGFSIGWGLFILVVLLGSSSGFRRGLNRTFYLDSEQFISITGGKTSESWNGLERGRAIRMKEDDAAALEGLALPDVNRMYPAVSKQLEIVNGNSVVTVPVVGCYDGYIGVNYRRLAAGRDIDELDIKSRSKVCLVNTRLAGQLFQKDDPLGRTILIDGIPYMVVGVCRSIMAQDVSSIAYVPFSTMMAVYCPDGVIDRIDIAVSGLTTAAANEALDSTLHSFVAARHDCSPTDYKGVKVTNQYEQTLKATNMVKGIGVFVWIIGIATLIAGVVGVSNIKLIAVKERTRELGVRKAMGTSNSGIIRLVLLESVLITVIFGSVGLMAAVGLTQLLDMLLGDVFPMFQNPTVDFWPVVICSFIMVLAGLVAGYVPAKRAVSIKLVDALNGTF